MKKSVCKGGSWREFVKSSVAKHRGPQPARLHRASKRLLVILSCWNAPSPSASKENRPQHALVLLVVKKSKEDPVYGTSFQSWAFLASLQIACCLLKHWAEGKTGCNVATDFVCGFCICVFHDCMALVLLWEPTSTSCHSDALPKEHVALS